MLIETLKSGNSFTGNYILKQPEIRVSQKGNKYFTGYLQDKSGKLEFKLWNEPAEAFCENQIVTVSGTVSEFRGNLNLILSHIQTADSNVDKSDLIPSAPIPEKAYKAQMTRLLQSINDPDYKALLLVIKKRYNDWFKAPAGKSVHHDYLNGLLMHTVHIMQLCSDACKLYPFLNRDLLITAAYLHDIGKPTGEFQFTGDGLVETYTTEGLLYGHLISGAMLIRDICREIQMDETKCMLLTHCILSHHGQPDYGAAVRPALPAADLLAKLDMMDAQMEIFRKTLSEQEPDTVSKNIAYLDNRRIYKA